MNYVREDNLGSVIRREIGMYHGYCLHLIEALIDSNMIDNQQRHAPFSSTVTMRLCIQLESLRAAGSRRLRSLGDASSSRHTLASTYRSSSTRCLPWSRSSAWWHRAPSRRGSASRLRSAHSAGHCGRAEGGQAHPLNLLGPACNAGRRAAAPLPAGPDSWQAARVLASDATQSAVCPNGRLSLTNLQIPIG